MTDKQLAVYVQALANDLDERLGAVEEVLLDALPDAYTESQRDWTGKETGSRYVPTLASLRHFCEALQAQAETLTEAKRE